MKKNRAFSSELQLFFYAEHNSKKIVTHDNQTYLLFYKQVQSFQAINQKASMLKRKGVATKRKQKEQFLSEFLTMETVST